MVHWHYYAAIAPTTQELIQSCWNHTPERRPTFRTIEKYLRDELARVKRVAAWNRPPGARGPLLTALPGSVVEGVASRVLQLGTIFCTSPSPSPEHSPDKESSQMRSKLGLARLEEESRGSRVGSGGDGNEDERGTGGSLTDPLLPPRPPSRRSSSAAAAGDTPFSSSFLSP